MSIFGVVNLDLLTVGISISAIGILGFIVYFNNRESITNRTFLLFALAATFWGTVNYLNYQFASAIIVLWLLRLVIFSAVWYSFFLFQFFYVFPQERFVFPKWYKFFLLPVVTLTSIINLTPFVFRGIAELAPIGQVSKAVHAPGIFLFTLVVIGLIIGAIFFLVKKIWKAEKLERLQYRPIALGVFFTFSFHIIFNLILPAIFSNVRFIPLGALFTFPFAAFTSYAIIKHKLFNIRVAGTAVLVFLLAVVAFGEVILARDLALIIYRSSILILVLVFGVLLIRGVMREVEQREKLAELNKKLQAAYEEVDRLSKAKSEFISIASHQLRTPLSAIKGYISMLVEGTYGKVAERARRPLENVFQSNERLIKLVNDLLSLSRIEAGRMEFEPEETQIEEIVGSVIQELKITAEQKKLYLNWEQPKIPLPKLLLDRDKIRQVFLNLLNNAVKYTKEGGITIKQSVINDKLLVIIKDTGEGMTKEDLAKLFESFSRGTIGAQVAAEGAGLGLYIARKFAEMHKGKVWAESEGKSKGSAFYVELPIK